jgi:hypothetical protein
VPAALPAAPRAGAPAIGAGSVVIVLVPAAPAAGIPAAAIAVPAEPDVTGPLCIAPDPVEEQALQTNTIPMTFVFNMSLVWPRAPAFLIRGFAIYASINSRSLAAP